MDRGFLICKWHYFYSAAISARWPTTLTHGRCSLKVFTSYRTSSLPRLWTSSSKDYEIETGAGLGSAHSAIPRSKENRNERMAGGLFPHSRRWFCIPAYGRRLWGD